MNQVISDIVEEKIIKKIQNYLRIKEFQIQDSQELSTE